MLNSSEEVISVTKVLKEELTNIIGLKEQLLNAMKHASRFVCSAICPILSIISPIDVDFCANNIIPSDAVFVDLIFSSNWLESSWIAIIPLSFFSFNACIFSIVCSTCSSDWVILLLNSWKISMLFSTCSICWFALLSYFPKLTWQCIQSLFGFLYLWCIFLQFLLLYWYLLLNSWKISMLFSTCSICWFALLDISSVDATISVVLS